ncbi:MAG: TolC family protein [Spirochaetota bacterium]
MHLYLFSAVLVLFITHIDATENRITKSLLHLSSKHPRLQAATQQLAGRILASKYASWKYPDPKLGVAWLNYPYKKDLRFLEDKTPMTGIEFRLTQAIPFPGRLTVQADIADSEVRQSRLQFALEKNKLAKKFLTLLLEIKSLLQITSLAREFEQKMILTADLATTKYSVGKGDLSDVSKAKLKRKAYTEKKVRFEGLLRSQKIAFSYFVPEEKQADNLLSENVKFFADLQKYLLLINTKVHNPSINIQKQSLLVAIQKERGDTHSFSAKLARYDYLPDFEVFAAYRKRAYIASDPVPGENFMSAGVAMRIPLWSALANHHKVAAKQKAYRSSQYLVQDSLQSDSSLFEAAKVHFQTLQERIKIYKENLLVDAQESLESTRLAYETGKSDFDSFLQAWDTLYHLKAGIIRLQEERDKQLLLMAFISNEILPDYPVEKENK